MSVEARYAAGLKNNGKSPLTRGEKQKGRAVTVDARGAICPLPTVMAALALEKRGPGDIVDVWADDPTTRRDLPGWCAEFGHRVLEIVDLRKGFQIRIQKHL